jgi:hypothetical protein
MLPPALKSRFEQCRRELSPGARSDLQRLAERLNMVNGKSVGGGDYLASFTRALVLTTPLSLEECKALAFYALCALCAVPTGTDPVLSGTGADSLMRTSANMQETQMSFNLQYLQIQKNMQNVDRQFAMVKNIMKTKHDTAKNTISNVH